VKKSAKPQGWPY